MMPENQLADRHVNPGKQRNIKIGKLNVACKMGLQNFLRTIAHHRVDSGAQTEERKEREEEYQSKNDGPFAHSA
jgi:hypothetical protein